MKIKLNTILYWLSIVRPIADIVLGAVKGIADTWKQINSDERKAKELEQMKIDHSMPFLSDYIDEKGENDNGQ